MMETEHTFTDGFTEDLIRETLLDPDKDSVTKHRLYADLTN